jgi:A/G-specific adenine glycosylase
LELTRKLESKTDMKKNTSSKISVDKELLSDVLAHYKKYGRHDLVWRKKINPYKILVSEVMLQQTQVSRVLPKFTEWMRRFPTLEGLSNASLHEVLVLWQGLGYQRRVKALLMIAKEVKRLPKSYEELLKLPGIGPYTASAICAFAYNTFVHPVLETNIRTILIEYFHLGEDEIHDGVLYDDLDRLVTYKEVKELGARHFYYALMDYGAYLKSQKISHNKKSAHHTVQSAYKGSSRELRAKVLFAITHGETLPQDERLEKVLEELEKEKYVLCKKNREYVLVDF